jgi:hypothetical protein
MAMQTVEFFLRNQHAFGLEIFPYVMQLELPYSKSLSPLLNRSHMTPLHNPIIFI